MDELSEKLNVFIPKGAGDGVDKVGKMLVERYGMDKLSSIAKLNFKNTEKIKESL